MGRQRMVAAVLLLALIALPVAAEPEREGVEIRAIEEQPRALHLISWRAPPPSRDHAPTMEDARVTRLLEPLDDRRFLEHLGFRQTLRLQLDDNND